MDILKNLKSANSRTIFRKGMRVGAVALSLLPLSMCSTAKEVAESPAGREVVERILQGSRTAGREAAEHGGQVGRGILSYKLGNKQVVTGTAEEGLFTQTMTYAKDISDPFMPGPDDVPDIIDCAIKATDQIAGPDGTPAQNHSRFTRGSDGNFYLELDVREIPQVGEACSVILKYLPQ